MTIVVDEKCFYKKEAEFKEKLEEVKAIMQNGGIAVYPTDTVYGIGCDPLNVSSVEKIFQIKKRDSSKPFPILLSSKNIASKIAVIPEKAEALISKFWPGALTLVVPPKIKFSKHFLSSNNKIAIRVPNHMVPTTLARFTGGMLVGTSANISGSPSSTTLSEALRQLENIDVAVDGGKVSNQPSTILELTGEDYEEVRIIREGAVSVQKIREVLGL